MGLVRFSILTVNHAPPARKRAKAREHVTGRSPYSLGPLGRALSMVQSQVRNLCVVSMQSTARIVTTDSPRDRPWDFDGKCILLFLVTLDHRARFIEAGSTRLRPTGFEQPQLLQINAERQESTRALFDPPGRSQVQDVIDY